MVHAELDNVPGVSTNDVFGEILQESYSVVESERSPGLWHRLWGDVVLGCEATH